jgi:endonuclease-8
MPEGPSIVILKEELVPFKGKKVLQAAGNAKIDIPRLVNLKVIDFKSWGKNFLICFKNFFLRIHLLMFGSYRINERKETSPGLSLVFKNGEINFYNCSIKMIEGDPADIYNWETDIMAEEWNGVKAQKALKALKKVKVTDALLDQKIFSGVGNIIKNEVLFRTKIHPETYVDKLPLKKLKELVKAAREYSFDFYRWKKKFELRENWLIYRKKECPRCKVEAKTAHLGKSQRLSTFCDNCQAWYK